MNTELTHRRAELLAELFLQELQPSMLTRILANRPFGDFYAVFRTKMSRSVTISVEVKATEKPITGDFRFRAPIRAAEAMRNSNIPMLLLVVDVKANEIYFNWASKAKEESHSPSPTRISTLTIPVRKATEASKKKLLEEIEAK